MSRILAFKATFAVAFRGKFKFYKGFYVENFEKIQKRRIFKILFQIYTFFFKFLFWKESKREVYDQKLENCDEKGGKPGS